jgi:hypothetical protein
MLKDLSVEKDSACATFQDIKILLNTFVELRMMDGNTLHGILSGDTEKLIFVAGANGYNYCIVKDKVVAVIYSKTDMGVA